jgi:hypothetical protein
MSLISLQIWPYFIFILSHPRKKLCHRRKIMLISYALAAVLLAVLNSDGDIP